MFIPPRLKIGAVTVDAFKQRAELIGVNAHAWIAGDPCVYCQRGGVATRAKVAMTLEHITPQSKRPKGWVGWKNHARACSGCNGNRGDTPFVRWILLRRRIDGPSTWHPFRKSKPAAKVTEGYGAISSQQRSVTVLKRDGEHESAGHDL